MSGIVPQPEPSQPNPSADEMAQPNPSLNPWTYKPWWCQPWSILLTGFGLILGSWIAIHSLWVTLLVALPLSVWMIYFLLIWPRLVVKFLPSSSQQFEQSP
jgi:hypothetical protein